MRCNPAQQRGSKKDTSKHFSHHTRLMEATEQASGDAAYRKNHSDLQNQRKQVRHQWSPLLGVPGALIDARSARKARDAQDGQLGAERIPASVPRPTFRSRSAVKTCWRPAHPTAAGSLDANAA